jgi:hypothetical protein
MIDDRIMSLAKGGSTTNEWIGFFQLMSTNC